MHGTCHFNRFNHFNILSNYSFQVLIFSTEPLAIYIFDHLKFENLFYFIFKSVVLQVYSHNSNLIKTLSKAHVIYFTKHYFKMLKNNQIIF